MKITLLSGKTFDFAKALGFEIKVNKSGIAKRLSLRIDERYHLPVLTIPRFCSNKKALAFVEDHRDWIQNMLAKLPQSALFENKTEVSIAGKSYVLIHNAKQRGAELKEEELHIGGAAEFLHRRTIDFLKKYAAQYLTEKSIATAAKIDCLVANVSIKETKSRWGSCSSRRNINYNWRIILAPSFVIDYLVCHEVAHLKHPDHSQEFWGCVASLCPSHKEGRHWLKVRGKELYRWL